MEAGIGHEWHFGYATPKTDEDDLRLEIARPATPEEIARADDAAGVLRRWLVDSPFYRFQAANDALESAIRSASQTEAPGHGHDLSRGLQSAVSEWLSKFRAFDDQTSHFLSREFGRKESTEAVAFKESLSLEYDLNRSYRFCVKLRNYAQHAGDPLQNIQFTTRDAKEGEELRVSLEFIPAHLLERYDRWGAPPL